MALKTKIAKGDFEALDESLKTLYVADGDNYKLDADYEDVTGLKNKANELLAEQKRLKEQMKAFDGLDPEAARAAIKAAQEAEDAKLEASGNIEAIRKQYEERIIALEAKHAAERDTDRSEYDATLATLKHERLANILTEKGVLPDRVKYVVHDLNNETELIRGDNGFEVRKKGGIGDAPEFDAMIEGIKTRSPFFFAADNIAGSGASGSNSNNGSGGGKTMPKAQWDALGVREQAAFIKSGGKPVD